MTYTRHAGHRPPGNPRLQQMNQATAAASDSRHRQILVDCARFGLQVDSNRPGDGRRRYQFTFPSGRTSSVVIGAERAEVFLEAYRAGWDERTTYAGEQSCTLQTPSSG